MTSFSEKLTSFSEKLTSFSDKVTSFSGTLTSFSVSSRRAFRLASSGRHFFSWLPALRKIRKWSVQKIEQDVFDVWDVLRCIWCLRRIKMYLMFETYKLRRIWCLRRIRTYLMFQLVFLKLTGMLSKRWMVAEETLSIPTFFYPEHLPGFNDLSE
jgi:hypothetical protein